MVVDTSALLAILFGEGDEDLYLDAIGGVAACRLSTVSYVELNMVAMSRPVAGREVVARFLLDLQVEVVPVDLDQAELAVVAFERFGKGRHHAGLNFGDCFAYALARSLHAPLLFKGDDFGHTDVTPVLSG